jgi:hypothetical protein
MILGIWVELLAIVFAVSGVELVPSLPQNSAKYKFWQPCS